jgi:hypothetical protein
MPKPMPGDPELPDEEVIGGIAAQSLHALREAMCRCDVSSALTPHLTPAANVKSCSWHCRHHDQR